MENDPQQIGQRNSGSRGSKDTIKVHKVPFPAFKKSKDKDKDKESNKDGAANMGVIKNGNVNTEQQNISSNSSGGKSAFNKKDKFLNRSSVQQISGESVDGGAGSATGGGILDNKVSPLPVLKRKSSNSIEMTTAGNNNAAVNEAVIQALTNGIETMPDAVDTIVETNSDVSAVRTNSHRTSITIDIKPNGHMQVSQV